MATVMLVIPIAADQFPGARSREITAFSLPDRRACCDRRSYQGRPRMKRSRRVVLTMMGSAARGAVSMGVVPRECGPGEVAVRMADGRFFCRRASYRGYGGFGGTLH